MRDPQALGGRVPRADQPRGRRRGPRVVRLTASCATSSSIATARDQAQRGGRRGRPRSRSTGRSPALGPLDPVSIEQDAEGSHHLDAPIVASPWSDDARLHDEAVTELRSRTRCPMSRASSTSTTPATRAPRRSTSRWSTVASPRPCSRRPRAGPSRRGPRRSMGPTRARARGDPRGGARALYPRGKTPGSSSAGRGCTALRIAALDAEAQPPTFTVEAELSRAPLPRGPRHGRRHRGLQGPRHHVHRALEARARRRPATPWRIVATAAVS